MASSQNQSTLIPSDKTQGACATSAVSKETKVADVKRKAEAQSWLAIFSGRLEEVSGAVKELCAAVPIMNKKLDAIFELQKGVLDIVNKLLEVLSKKTGIFQVAASGQASKQQPEPQLPAELKGFPADLKEKLIPCPGGVKLKHYYPGDVWSSIHDMLTALGYVWTKDENDKKASHWTKETKT